MQRYANYSDNSGVVAYETGPTHIDVQFTDGAVYRYTYASAGAPNVEHMKQLAQAGRGLNTFISTCVRDDYAGKIR